ncbi:putative helicase [Tetrabaena socialis]|uniref:Putative helicase n=1 Tax=Tetrabaena socialis TaxID=47790 RepID=A0A2J7ZM99_9CHLO|nr:putative helicase [Tetrabaena socialis]|eukprot:PNH01399.1 putative helicase [Tetrabaena socialis]
MSVLDLINTSKVAWGLGTVTMQLGARYVVGDLTEMQNKVLGTMVAKRIVLCGMIFIATRDIVIAIILTAAIHAVLTWLFNEKSGLCVVPMSARPSRLESTAVSMVTPEQYAGAVLTLQRYRDQNGLPTLVSGAAVEAVRELARRRYGLDELGLNELGLNDLDAFVTVFRKYGGVHAPLPVEMGYALLEAATGSRGAPWVAMQDAIIGCALCLGTSDMYKADGMLFGTDIVSFAIEHGDRGLINRLGKRYLNSLLSDWLKTDLEKLHEVASLIDASRINFPMMGRVLGMSIANDVGGASPSPSTSEAIKMVDAVAALFRPHNKPLPLLEVVVRSVRKKLDPWDVPRRTAIVDDQEDDQEDDPDDQDDQDDSVVDITAVVAHLMAQPDVDTTRMRDVLHALTAWGYKGTGEDMDAHAQRLIAQRYAFIGFLKFANQVAKMTDAEIVEAYAKHLFIIDEAHNLRSQKESGSKPAYRALQRVLRLCHGTKILLLTATPMFNDAREIVDLVNLLLINDNRPLLKRSAIFSDEGTLLDGETFARACVGYVSHVSGRNPLRFPIIFDPTVDKDPALVQAHRLPTLDVSGESIPGAMRIKATCIVGSVMSAGQYKQYIESGAGDLPPAYIDDFQEDDEPGKDAVEDVEGIPPSFRPGFEVSNLSFPLVPGHRIKGSSSMFWSCFHRLPGKEFAVEYMPGSPAAAHGGFLAARNLGRWSCKFKTILDRILTSTGITFVYSRFLWAGLVPFAIALEHAGFRRHGQRGILADKHKETDDSQGSYIILTSDTRLCSRSTFARDLATAVSRVNASGSVVRVILACGVATEGIDFKCVRSVHLVDPWYHNNKVNQIIGRASRNCSHGELPVPARNVTVYMHASLPPAHIQRARETVDLHAYRISEFKQSKISIVEGLLKAISVDCELNRHAQQRESLLKTTVDLVTAQGSGVKRYRVSQKLDATSGTCIVDAGTKEYGTDSSTYDPWFHADDSIKLHLRAIVHSFKASHRYIMNAAELQDAVQARTGARFKKHIFLYALQHGIETSTLLYRGGVYLLKPAGSTAIDDLASCPMIVPVQSVADAKSNHRSSIIREKVKIIPKEIGSNIREVILAKLQNKLEGSCTRHGYVRPGSVKIHELSPGRIEGSSLNGDILYTVLVLADICNPIPGQTVPARIVNSNKFALLAHSGIEIDGKYTTILETVITRYQSGSVDNQLVDSVRVGDDVFVEVMGKTFELNDNKISICGRLLRTVGAGGGKRPLLSTAVINADLNDVDEVNDDADVVSVDLAESDDADPGSGDEEEDEDEARSEADVEEEEEEGQVDDEEIDDDFEAMTVDDDDFASEVAGPVVGR